MVGAFVSRLSHLGSSLCQGCCVVLCWVTQFTLTVPLSIQVYNTWVCVWGGGGGGWSGGGGGITL